MAYQSEVANSPIPWTQSAINDWIRSRKQEGVDTVVAASIGFLSDHVEVLYDLYIEASETAKACGIDFIQASTVSVHRKFISMFADFVCEKAFSQPAPEISSARARIHRFEEWIRQKRASQGKEK